MSASLAGIASLPGVAMDGDGNDVPGVSHRRIDVGGISLHVALCGDWSARETQPLVVLLHGFPEFWWSWRHQIPALAEAGFRVAAPDLRGYNLSEQPPRVEDYTMRSLTGDVDGLIRALGESRAHVVGHDWGAAIAWDFAARYPERLDRLAILNVPHPRRMTRALLRSPRQIYRSWYIFFFQVPHLPELLVQQNDYASLRKSLAAGRLVRPTDAELEPYVTAARRAEGLRGGMNFYRAAFRSLLGKESAGDTRRAVIDAEVLVIWGERDLFLGRELADPPKRLVPRARVVRIPEASHWVQVDSPARVNALLVPFLRGVA